VSVARYTAPYFDLNTLNDSLIKVAVEKPNVPGYGTATAAAGAATLNAYAGKVTSEALTTAINATYTLTLTNSQIAADDIVFASVANGTNSAGTPVLSTVKPASGSVVIIVYNKHTANAFNGTLVISFEVRKK
jgi:hypothetical protein